MSQVRTALWCTLAWITLQSGCTQQPGALTLQLSGQKATYSCEEPVRLRATLKAGDKPVCLARDLWFAAKVSRIDGGAEAVTSPIYVQCGMNAMCTLLFFPYLHLVAMLDVADVQDRYVVLRPFEMQSFDLVLGVQDRDEDGAHGRGRFGGDGPPCVCWQPGRYRLAIQLENVSAGHLAHSIGWAPYSRPVESFIEFEVQE